MFKKKSPVTWERYKNPDGSLGGMIQAGCEIPEGVSMDSTAVVVDSTKLVPGQHLRLGEIATEHGIISFS